MAGKIGRTQPGKHIYDDELLDGKKNMIVENCEESGT
jgi:hypothetical protein